MQITLNLASIIGMLGVPFLSMVVGFVTSKMASSRYKVGLLVVLSFVYAVVEEYLTNTGGFNIWVALVKVGVAFMVAVNTHYGFSKPIGFTDWLQQNGPQLGAPRTYVRRQQ